MNGAHHAPTVRRLADRLRWCRLIAAIGVTVGVALQTADAQRPGRSRDCGYSFGDFDSFGWSPRLPIARPWLPCLPPIFGHGRIITIGVVDPVFVLPTPVFINPTPPLVNVPAPAFARPAVRPPRQLAPNNLAPNHLNLAPEKLNRGLIDPGPFDGLAEIRRRASVLKRSTPEGRMRADRMIGVADEKFRKQSYAQAVARYRKAISKAPDYAEGHFRLAHALVAIGRFDQASQRVMIALQLAATARRDGFNLAQLYEGNKFARERHDEQLEVAAKREPADGGLQFLLGFTKHYSGKPLQAREHFRAAARLAGPQQAFVRHFLPVPPVKEAGEAPELDRPPGRVNRPLPRLDGGLAL